VAILLRFEGVLNRPVFMLGLEEGSGTTLGRRGLPGQ